MRFPLPGTRDRLFGCEDDDEPPDTGARRVVTTLTPDRWVHQALCVTRPINTDGFYPGKKTPRQDVEAAPGPLCDVPCQPGMPAKRD